MNQKPNASLMVLILISLVIFLTPLLVAAASNVLVPSDPVGITVDTVGNSAGYNTDINRSTALSSFAGTLVRILLSFLGVLFMAYTVYGGFLWLTSAGSEEKVDKAKKIIRDGVIGLVVILSATAIYLFVIEALTAPAVGNYDPTLKGKEIRQNATGDFRFFWEY